ncbi:MAG: hypothetical protein HXY34_06660 [Candidatus Thorarchaeota archaeon]|nr:hypothetical protein [Candidatus Thorarchaeota archaeon]
MLQSEALVWILEIVVIVAIPAILLANVGNYIEAVIYNSLRPDPFVTRSIGREHILRAYEHSRRSLDLLLLLLYACSLLLMTIAGILLGAVLGEAKGLSLGLVFGLMMVSDLRHGVRLQRRLERKLTREKQLWEDYWHRSDGGIANVSSQIMSWLERRHRSGKLDDEWLRWGLRTVLENAQSGDASSRRVLEETRSRTDEFGQRVNKMLTLIEQ